MTSTPVKSVGVMAGGQSVGVSGVRIAGQDSFEQVWTRQTDKNAAPQTAQGDERTAARRDSTVARDSLKTGDARRDTVKTADKADKADSSDSPDMGKEPVTDDLRDMDPEEWEEAMEVLSAAVSELTQQIADSFDMTTGEVEELMADLGIEGLELLQPEKLSGLLLAAGNAQDATDLLTDGELYGQYCDLMQQAADLLEMSGEQLDVDAGKLVDIAVEQSEPVEDAQEALPVIEVTVEDGMPVKEETDTPEEPVPQQSAESVAKDTVVQQPKESQNGGQTTQDRTGEQREHTPDRGRSDNLFQQQNLQLQRFDSPQTQPTELTSVWDTDTQDIMRQIMDYMKIQVKPDMSDLEMQLHPANLGTLQIHVASRGGVVTAQFVTQNENVKAALESQMIQLKESFAQQGVKVEAVEVSVQTHHFEQNLEQGRGRQQEEPDRRARGRRIRLDEPFSMENPAEAQEENLAAQMMELGGSTVDFTV